MLTLTIVSVVFNQEATVITYTRSDNGLNESISIGPNSSTDTINKALQQTANAISAQVALAAALVGQTVIAQAAVL